MPLVHPHGHALRRPAGREGPARPQHARPAHRRRDLARAGALPASHFRNKAKLVVGGSAGRPTLGILDPGGRGVDLRRCGLYEPGLSATFDPLHRLLADHRVVPYDVPARKGELKHLLVTHSPDGEHLVRFVVRTQEGLQAVRRLLPDLRAALPSARVVTVNLHPEHKAVLEGETEVVLTDDAVLPMRLGGVTLRLGPRAFFQTNTTVATALYAQAAEWADRLSPTAVTDLYCGVGGFALHLAAPGRRVTGVEVSTEAVAAARASADEMRSATTGLDITFTAGDATDSVPGDPTSSWSTRRAGASAPTSPPGSRPPRPATSCTPAATSTPSPATWVRCRPSPSGGACRRHVPADPARRDRPAPRARLTRTCPRRRPRVEA